MSSYHWSPEWQLEQRGDSLRLNAGADLIYEIHDIEPDALAELLVLPHVEVFELCHMNTARGIAVAEELIAAAILIPTHIDSSPTTVDLRWIGSPLPSLDAELRRLVTVVDGQKSSLSIVVRSGGLLTDVATVHSDRPHVLVDVALHHTISLGPLVIPGDSACLACYARSVADEWGDPAPPQSPRMAHRVALVAALIADEIDAIATGTFRLLGRCVAYDLASHTARITPAYRRPGCTRCDPAARVAHTAVYQPA